jgi:hypothetical protein
MGLMKLAQQANKPKGSFPYVVGIILVVLMILNVIVSSIERLIPLGNVGIVIEGILLVARAIMAVLYGHAIHSLKEDEHTVTGIVKTSDIYDWLDNQQQTINTLGGKVDTLGAVSDTLSTQLTTTSTSLSTQLGNVGSTLSTLTNTLSSLAQKLVEVDNRLATVDTHLGQVETNQGNQFQQFQGTLAEVREAELAPLASQMHNVTQAVFTLGTALAHYDTRLGEVDSRLYQVEESQGSRFTELHSSLRAIVVEVRQATMNELSRGLSPLVEQMGTFKAGALLAAPSRQPGNNAETQKGSATRKGGALPTRTVNQVTVKQENNENEQAGAIVQGTQKAMNRERITRRLDTQLDNPQGEQLDTLLDKESEEVDTLLDNPELDRGEGGKIISLSSGTRLDTRSKQADITAYILEFIHREGREPSLSEIQNGAGCAKQTAINARNAAREILQQREQNDSGETSQAANS